MAEAAGSFAGGGGGTAGTEDDGTLLTVASLALVALFVLYYGPAKSCLHYRGLVRIREMREWHKGELLCWDSSDEEEDDDDGAELPTTHEEVAAAALLKHYRAFPRLWLAPTSISAVEQAAGWAPSLLTSRQSSESRASTIRTFRQFELRQRLAFAIGVSGAPIAFDILELTAEHIVQMQLRTERLLRDEDALQGSVMVQDGPGRWVRLRDTLEEAAGAEERLFADVCKPWEQTRALCTLACSRRVGERQQPAILMLERPGYVRRCASSTPPRGQLVTGLALRAWSAGATASQRSAGAALLGALSRSAGLASACLLVATTYLVWHPFALVWLAMVVSFVAVPLIMVLVPLDLPDRLASPAAMQSWMKDAYAATCVDESWLPQRCHAPLRSHMPAGAQIGSVDHAEIDSVCSRPGGLGIAGSEAGSDDAYVCFWSTSSAELTRMSLLAAAAVFLVVTVCGVVPPPACCAPVRKRARGPRPVSVVYAARIRAAAVFLGFGAFLVLVLSPSIAEQEHSDRTRSHSEWPLLLLGGVSKSGTQDRLDGLVWLTRRAVALAQSVDTRVQDLVEVDCSAEAPTFANLSLASAELVRSLTDLSDPVEDWSASVGSAQRWQDGPLIALCVLMLMGVLGVYPGVHSSGLCQFGVTTYMKGRASNRLLKHIPSILAAEMAYIASKSLLASTAMCDAATEFGENRTNCAGVSLTPLLFERPLLQLATEDDVAAAAQSLGLSDVIAESAPDGLLRVRRLPLGVFVGSEVPVRQSDRNMAGALRLDSLGRVAVCPAERDIGSVHTWQALEQTLAALASNASLAARCPAVSMLDLASQLLQRQSPSPSEPTAADCTQEDLFTYSDSAAFKRFEIQLDAGSGISPHPTSPASISGRWAQEPGGASDEAAAQELVELGSLIQPCGSVWKEAVGAVRLACAENVARRLPAAAAGIMIAAWLRVLITWARWYRVRARRSGRFGDFASPAP